MRHRVYGKHLGRRNDERTALFKGLVQNLLIHESISTTEAKAKAIKGLVDKLITAGRKNSESSKRVVTAFLPKSTTNVKLLTDIAPRFKNRTSGFTSTVRLGRRLGDGAMLVKMSLVADSAATVKEENKEIELKEKEVVVESKEKKETKTK